MATKKKSDSEDQKTKEEPSGLDDALPQAEKGPPTETPPKEFPNNSDGEESGGQLFFSTDGEESAPPSENPYKEESTKSAPENKDAAEGGTEPKSPKPHHNKGPQGYIKPTRAGERPHKREGRKQNCRKGSKNRGREVRNQESSQEETESHP